MTRRLPTNWKTGLVVVRRKTKGKFYLEFKNKQEQFAKHQGVLSVCIDKPHKVYSADVNLTFRHRNQGYKLYTTALRAYGQLSTYYESASGDAQKLWRRLKEDYCYRTNSNTCILTVYNRKRKRKHKDK